MKTTATKLFVWGVAGNAGSLFGMADLPQSSPLPTTGPSLQLVNYTTPGNTIGCSNPGALGDKFYKYCRHSVSPLIFFICLCVHLCVDVCGPPLNIRFFFFFGPQIRVILLFYFRASKHTALSTSFSPGMAPKPWTPSTCPSNPSQIYSRTLSQASLVTHLRPTCCFSLASFHPRLPRVAILGLVITCSRPWRSRVPLQDPC